MSIRKLIVQYVGGVLFLPKLERDVMRIYERDRTGRRVREYVPIVRCKDCKDYEDTGNCYFWASYEPIPGGDEYREVLAEVTPNGYCAWGKRREQ